MQSLISATQQLEAWRDAPAPLIYHMSNESPSDALNMMTACPMAHHRISTKLNMAAIIVRAQVHCEEAGHWCGGHIWD